MYRHRVALEWRAAVAVVAVVAVLGTVLGQVPRPIDGVWLLCGFGATVLVAAVLLVLAFRCPVDAPPAMPTRFGYTEATAADARVRRGEPVDPPELQAAAIDHARRGLRIGHLGLGWFPIMGGSWALRLGEGGFFGGFGYVGLAVMLIGVAGLAWSGVVQRRLDHLEDTSDAGSRAEPRGDSPGE